VRTILCVGRQVLTVVVDSRQKSYVFDFLFDHRQRPFGTCTSVNTYKNVGSTRGVGNLRSRKFAWRTFAARAQVANRTPPSMCTALRTAALSLYILTFSTLRRTCARRSATLRTRPFEGREGSSATRWG